MARTFFELPNDLIIDIFDKKAELEMAERPDLFMTNNFTTCYSCGNHAENTKCRFNGINYKFCSFCWGGPVSTDDVEDFINYVNNWQIGDYLRMEKMYHQAVAPGASEDAWSNFWTFALTEEERTWSIDSIKDIYDRYLNMIDTYSDLIDGMMPDTPPGNEHVIFWDEYDTDSDADSGR